GQWGIVRRAGAGRWASGSDSLWEERGGEIHMNSQRNVLLALAVLVACDAAASIASANNTAVPRAGVHNGVITVCIEPPTKGNRATSGGLNLFVCAKGAGGGSWDVRGPPGGRGVAGPARAARAPGTPGAAGGPSAA